MSWLWPALTPTRHCRIGVQCSVDRSGCCTDEAEPGTWLQSLLITHALNISSDVIKAPEIKCLSQAKQAGSRIQFGQDNGK